METDEQLMLDDILGVEDVEDAHVREVYAKFGLAIYHAQVFEHGIVNAITFLDLIPNRRHLARSREEWEQDVDSFMSKHFEKTMGSMLRTLAQHTTVDLTLDETLREALKARNYLAHDFFRDKAGAFITASGRHAMLEEIDDCSAALRKADSALNNVIEPVRNKYGITDAVIQKELEKYGLEPESSN